MFRPAEIQAFLDKVVALVRHNISPTEFDGFVEALRAIPGEVTGGRHALEDGTEAP